MHLCSAITCTPYPLPCLWISSSDSGSNQSREWYYQYGWDGPWAFWALLGSPLVTVMSPVHALNLSIGKLMWNDLVLILHPSTMISSDTVPSSFNFDDDRTSSHGRGSAPSTSLHTVWIVSREAPEPLHQLSPVCGTIVITSSLTKSSMCPMSSVGMSMSRGSTLMNGS